jgi:uncharacterized membrane protein YhaH (DUF805 family)
MSGGPIDWRELFAASAGRTARAPAWIAIAVLLGVSALYETAAVSTVKFLTFWFVDPLLLASGACVIAKRLHDRGRSGWWAALVLFAFVLVWPSPHGARAVIALPVLIWAVVELGLLPGEPGVNRFGPSPLATAPI